MKEWCKKYLGLFGFGVLLFGVLITIISNFILGNEIDSNIAMGSFLIMAGAQTIQDILNEKYFTKYSKKIKNGIIIFIIISTSLIFLVPLILL
tara:strand:+ start:3893 stop:4171 length:279 start_codon:yes stop_codon:yes gene_type:complete